MKDEHFTSFKKNKHMAVEPNQQFQCTGGKDPSNLSKIEYITLFNANSCSPLVVVPGILSSKLILEIDCPVFRENHPKAFEACGWNSCGSPGSDGTPDLEYQIWVPEVTSPFSFIRLLDNDPNKCFTTIFGMDISKDEKTGLLHFSDKKGVSISPLGSTESSRRNSHCGFDAMCNMLPTNDYIELNLDFFEPMRVFLEKMGYVHGLTLQGLPSDWRLVIQDNKLNDKFMKVLVEMNGITGKKITIVGHSMGNINIYHNLLNIDHKNKDELVERWIAIAPPFMGGPMALTYSLTYNGIGYDNMLGEFGMSASDMRDTASKIPSVF